MGCPGVFQDKKRMKEIRGQCVAVLDRSENTIHINDIYADSAAAGA